MAPLSGFSPQQPEEPLKHTPKREPSAENPPTPPALPTGRGSWVGLAPGPAAPTGSPRRERGGAQSGFLAVARMCQALSCLRTFAHGDPLGAKPYSLPPPTSFSFRPPLADLTRSPSVCHQRNPITLSPGTHFSVYFLLPLSEGTETWPILGVTSSPEFGTEPEIVGDGPNDRPSS